MKDVIKKYILIKWWISLMLFIFAALICLALLSSTNEWLLIISDYFLLTTIILLLVAGVWQLIEGEWYWAALQLGILFVGIIGLIAIWLYTFAPSTDTFADNVNIPENIDLELPIDLHVDENFNRIYADSLLTKKSALDFQLYNSFQPGLYEYDIWLSTDKSGYVYLKAFEITQEIELSESRLKESSTVQIENTHEMIKKFGTNHHFTIYEGDWGQPYGARFEVWFKADNQDEEIKLLEKNYVIEGWMR